MRVLIGQPVHEEGVHRLLKDIKANGAVDIIIYPEGYLSNEKALEDACAIAKENNVMIITAYRKDNKDRAVIINSAGEKILERAKTSADEGAELNEPLYVNFQGMNIGYLLCMEILKGMRDLKRAGVHFDFIAHPIGVGMFSDEQFDMWIKEAKDIAKTYNTVIIGASHADGSYRDCGVSIPISYCINSDGQPIYISKSDIRTRIVNLDTKECIVV